MNDEKKYWDEKYEKRLGDIGHVFPQRGDADEIRKLCFWIENLRQAQDYKDFVILDIGPGTGQIYSHIDHAFPGYFTCENYKMIELSPVAAAYCNIMTGIEPFVIDDPTKIPMGDNSVDLVICHSVLMHTPPKQAEKLFAEMVRVSKEYIYLGEYMKNTKELKPHNWVHEYHYLINQSGMLYVDIYEGKTAGRYDILACKHVLSEEAVEVLMPTNNPIGGKLRKLIENIKLVNEKVCAKKNDPPTSQKGNSGVTGKKNDPPKIAKKNEKNVRRSKSGGRKTVRRRKG